MEAFRRILASHEADKLSDPRLQREARRPSADLCKARCQDPREEHLRPGERLKSMGKQHIKDGCSTVVL